MHFEPWKNALAFRQTRLWRVLFVTLHLYLLHLLFLQLSWVCASQSFLQEWDGIPYLFQCSLLEDLGSVNITKDHTVTQKVNNVFISDIYFLLKPILFASSWFIKQEFVNTLVPKLSIHQCYHYIIIIKKRERFHICNKNTISQYFLWYFLFGMCYKVEHVECHKALHHSSLGNYTWMAVQQNCPAKANCTVLTKDVLQSSVQTTLRCWGET